jgi:ribosomal-protein-alanine N-acetyltransferase
VKEIETKRLILGPHSTANLEKIHIWQNDTATLWLNSDEVRYQSLEDTARALERWAKLPAEHTEHWAIYRRADGELIGFAQVAMIETVHKRCKLGITIGGTSDRGHGYGAEAVNALARHCFEDLGLNRITAEVFSFNIAAVRLFERCGFLREGTLRESVWKSGFADEYVYSLLKSDWEAAHHIRPCQGADESC